MSATTPNLGSTRHYDAIVVGARAAGAATAMLLGRAGRRVLLVDRAAYGSDTLSSHALMRGAVVQLQRWRLLERLRESETPAIRRAVFHYGDDEVDLAIRDQHGLDALYAPRRTVLDPILVDAARADGVDVVFGARVVSLLRSADGRVTGISARKASEDFIAFGDIVIGADGATSTVARLVGAPDTFGRPARSAFVYGYFRGLATDRYHWYFRPGAMAGVVPTNGAVANVVVGVPPDRFEAVVRREGTEALFRTVLRELAPDLARRLADARPVARFRSSPGLPAHLRRAHGPGWALVGDAGYHTDAMTAHGISNALRDAELLARSLVDHGDAYAYAATRDRLAAPVLEASAGLAGYAWDLAGAQQLHRTLAAAMDDDLALLTSFDAVPAGV
jgi:flavin-dependent dehydrogenase